MELDFRYQLHLLLLPLHLMAASHLHAVLYLLPRCQVELDFQYPSEGIHKRWDAGYRITCCGATRDQVRGLKLVARACSEWQDGDEWQGRGGGGSWMGWVQATALSAAGRHGTRCAASKLLLQGQLRVQAPASWAPSSCCVLSGCQRMR